jgi:hypothetical protein
MSEPIILLSSGETLKLRSVLLYNEQRLRDIENLRARAMAKAGPANSGIGFIGSPGWVLGASAVMSLFEAAATRRLQQEALTLLREAERRSQALVDTARQCDFAALGNAHLPHPELWRAVTTEDFQVDFKALSWSDRSMTLERYRKTKADVVDGILTITQQVTYVHNGDDFLLVTTDVGPLNIRWSAVVAYRGAPPAPPTFLPAALESGPFE